jgi:hypothetical protein
MCLRTIPVSALRGHRSCPPSLKLLPTEWDNRPKESPLGGPAVGMVVIVPAGLPQESRPGGPTGSIKERVVYCCGEKLIRNNVQNNCLKV